MKEDDDGGGDDGGQVRLYVLAFPVKMVSQEDDGDIWKFEIQRYKDR